MRTDTVLVTGATSPLGDVLMPVLTANFQRVVGVARTDAGAARIADLGAEPAIWDLASDTPPPASEADVFIHAAGIRLASGAIALGRASGAHKTVVLSSASATANGHPDRDQLRRAEISFSELDNATILRPTMIYGSPRDRNVRRLNVALAKLPAVPNFRGGGRMSPVLADDLVNAILEAIHMDAAVPVPVAGPRPVQFGELVDELCRAAGHKRLGISVPVPVLAHFGRATGRHFGKVSHALEMLTVDRSAPPPEEVGFKYAPTPLAVGIELALRRYRSGRSAPNSTRLGRHVE